MEIVVRPLTKSDWNSVSKIYQEGINTGIATFETKVPNWQQWDAKYVSVCRLVALVKTSVVGFAVLSPVSKRHVYKGVAEVSVYVSKAFKGNHIGETLLKKLIEESEASGFWTLQASIFSENIASINLHLKCGFRVIGIREKVGQLNGKWYDNHFLERRSSKID
ncbi:GNAT family N-acetyltransferase [Flavivirga rizhaonensis]|uniref:N-acetyltransferase family protein n=1 Tax=Flavivirga rizhaonensis TaxID=2559571 RepID=A0A4S1DUS6_9FLAO|nr:GNAT family N-acetyltransferase [Flavivirga rizhaonensis]TGV01787.1 N-acetyltransferase family protein [Flavivirga rizhaonensis]